MWFRTKRLKLLKVLTRKPLTARATMGNEAASTRLARRAHELAFSLNLAWIVVWGPRITDKILVHRPVVRTLEPPTIVDQTEWSLFLAAIIFVAVLLLDRLSLVRLSLRTLAGICALAGFPFLALRTPSFFLQTLAYEDRFAIGRGWAFCEVAIVLICALLYYVRRWPVPNAVGVLLLILRFGFWSWLTGTHRVAVYQHSGRKSLSAKQNGTARCDNARRCSLRLYSTPRNQISRPKRREMQARNTGFIEASGQSKTIHRET